MNDLKGDKMNTQKKEKKEKKYIVVFSCEDIDDPKDKSFSTLKEARAFVSGLSWGASEYSGSVYTYIENGSSLDNDEEDFVEIAQDYIRRLI